MELKFVREDVVVSFTLMFQLLKRISCLSRLYKYKFTIDHKWMYIRALSSFIILTLCWLWCFIFLETLKFALSNIRYSLDRDIINEIDGIIIQKRKSFFIYLFRHKSLRFNLMTQNAGHAIIQNTGRMGQSVWHGFTEKSFYH